MEPAADDPPVVFMADPVLLMRFRRLLEAGYDAHHATEIAFRRDIDLHRAEELAQTAGTELAYSILF